MHDLRFLIGFAVQLSHRQSQRDTMQRFLGRMMEQIRDVEDPLLVLEDRGLPFEDEFPESEMAAESVDVVTTGSPESVRGWLKVAGFRFGRGGFAGSA